MTGYVSASSRQDRRLQRGLTSQGADKEDVEAHRGEAVFTQLPRKS